MTKKTLKCKRRLKLKLLSLKPAPERITTYSNNLICYLTRLKRRKCKRIKLESRLLRKKQTRSRFWMSKRSWLKSVLKQLKRLKAITNLKFKRQWINRMLFGNRGFNWQTNWSILRIKTSYYISIQSKFEIRKNCWSVRSLN
jgi:hypothetical protein